jgi:hypothetical protein
MAAGMKAATTPQGAPPPSPDAVLRIAAEVRRQRSQTGREYLTHSGTGRVVQVGGMSAVLLERLERGVRLADLIAEIELTYPGVGLKITAFVAQLERAGMLENSPGQKTARQYVIAMPNPDRAARAVAAAFSRLAPQLRWALLFVCLAGSLVLGFMVAIGGSLQAMRDVLDPHVALVVLLLPPFSLAHEFAHAVAARFVGVPIVAAGILLRPWRTTASFVRTDDSILALPRGKRMQVCLAGPVADLTTIGVVSAVLLVTPAGSPWALVLSMAFLLKAASFTSNLSPLNKSDMSDALGALFDDYRIRGVALGADPRKQLFSTAQVRSYRIFAAVFVVVALGLWIGLVAAIFS